MEGEDSIGLPARGECRRAFLERTGAGNVDRVAFLLVDVDDFSRFNVMYSHSFGDRFLERSDRDMLDLLPDGYEACRYGVDQLLIAGYGCGVSDMRTVFRRLSHYARAEHELDGVRYRFALSAAIVAYPGDAQDWDSIEKGLSVALRRAKRDGGDRVVLFTSSLLGERLYEQGLMAQLARDVETGFRGFRVVHQPLCDSAALRVCGAEALLRYNTPSGVAISPVELVPVLESSGLIKPVGLWVFDQAVADCKKWVDLIPEFRMDVNISVVQLDDPAFGSEVIRRIDQSGLGAEHIVLELTESLYMNEEKDVAANIETLRKRGFGFAVDDFGMGYSSLSRLMTFDCDLVKIDRAFVQMLSANSANNEFVRSVVELCHRYGKKVCAEGVEDIEELQAVNAVHADIVQGFYVSRPVEKEEFERTFVEGDFGGDVLRFTPDAAFRRMQLAYNRDLLLSMVKAMPVSMHLMDSRCEVVMWNDATLALFGYPPDVDRVDVFGELLPALQPDGTPSLKKAEDLVARARETGRETFEWLHLDVAGGQLPVEVTIIVLDVIDEYGEDMIACFLRDLRPQRESEERDRQFNRKLKAIIDATPLCLNLWNHRFENVMCNKEAVELFGLENEQDYLNGFDALSPEFQPDGASSKEKARAKIEEAFRTGGCTFSWLHRRPDGEDIPAEITLAKIDIQDEDGFDLVVGFTRDLRVFDGPRRSGGLGAGEVFRNLVDASDNQQLIDELRIDAVFWDIVSDVSDELLFRLMARTSTIEYLGRLRDSFDIEPRMEDFPNSVVERGNIHPDDVPAFLELARNMKAGIVRPVDLRFVMKGGGCHWFRIVYDCMYDEHGAPVMAAGKAIDIQAEKDFEQRSRVDLLTHCVNKVTFEEEVRGTLARTEPDDEHALFIVDIDDFKAVNDLLGHHYGDLVLVDVAARLRLCFEAEAVIGRIGGDEFVVFAPGLTGRDRIRERARALVEVVADMDASTMAGRRISVSVGVALFPRDGRSYDELYQASDKALYQSKREGKNRFTLYSPELACGTMVNRTILDNASRMANEYFDADLVSTVFSLLYETSDMHASVNAVLKFLGMRLEADRCYLFESADGGATYSNTYEWCDVGIEPEIDGLQGIPRETWSDFFEQADPNGIVYCNDLSALKNAEAFEIMRVQGIRSFLHAQVSAKGVVATILGADDCRRARVWSEKEINSMLYASKILFTFLVGEQRNSALIKKAEELGDSYATLEYVLEGSDTFTYVVDPATHDVLYANKRLRDQTPLACVGEKCYRAVRRKDAPCDNCPLPAMGERDDMPPLELMDNGMKMISSVKRIAWKDERTAVMVNVMDVTGRG